MRLGGGLSLRVSGAGEGKNFMETLTYIQISLTYIQISLTYIQISLRI
jgi:hypothetical protein